MKLVEKLSGRNKIAMGLNLKLIILISFFQVCTFTNQNKKTANDDIFIPTHEWQIVKKGQKIPKGLHVRINFETGVTEAKLLDDDDTNKNKAVSISVTKAESTAHSPEELKEALKNIKDESVPNKKSEKKKFKSYEELKADLESLNLSPKSDFEILSELISQHRRILKEKMDDDGYLLTILQDFEYLVHQYDNANQFVSLNGFADVILVDLNSTNLEVKLEALKLLGSSVQNNAKVQIHALEKGCVGVLLRILVLDSNIGVKSRAIFALSGILRRFPLAQLKFLEEAGVSIFVGLLDKTNNLKVHLRIVTLINDLLLEHQDVLNQTEVNPKIKQYDRINLEEKLSTFHWCNSLQKVLVNVVSSDADDHDGVEKCLTAVYTAKETCDLESASALRGGALLLSKHYAKLVESERGSEEDMSDFFAHMLGLCNNIADYFKLKYKIEL